MVEQGRQVGGRGVDQAVGADPDQAEPGRAVGLARRAAGVAVRNSVVGELGRVGESARAGAQAEIGGLQLQGDACRRRAPLASAAPTPSRRAATGCAPAPRRRPRRGRRWSRPRSMRAGQSGLDARDRPRRGRAARGAPRSGRSAAPVRARRARASWPITRDAVGGEPALHRARRRPTASRPACRRGTPAASAAADHREAARLVEVGGELGEKLVVAEPDRHGDRRASPRPGGRARRAAAPAPRRADARCRPRSRNASSIDNGSTSGVSRRISARTARPTSRYLRHVRADHHGVAGRRPAP